MKLAIFGATGKTGRLILQAALAAAHDVTACVHDPARLTTKPGQFRVVVGGVDHGQMMFDAVRGADAVISAVGGGGETLTTFARTIFARCDKRTYPASSASSAPASMCLVTTQRLDVSRSML